MKNAYIATVATFCVLNLVTVANLTDPIFLSKKYKGFSRFIKFPTLFFNF